MSAVSLPTQLRVRHTALQNELKRLADQRAAKARELQTLEDRHRLVQTEWAMLEAEIQRTGSGR